MLQAYNGFVLQTGCYKHIIEKWKEVIINSVRVPRLLVTMTTADIPVLHYAEVVHFPCES